MWMGDQRLAAAALPLGKTRYPLYRKLGGTQDQSGRVRKIWPVVQTVASRYIDRAIAAHS